MGGLHMLGERLNKTKQECWKIIRDMYPEKLDKYAIVTELFDRTLQAGDVVLDAGCGHKSLVRQGGHVPFSLIGFDMVWEDIRQNHSVDLGLVSDIGHVPVRSESLDIVICNMVLEHLREPDMVFRELSRVLRKGGHLIVMTPSIFNIVTIVNGLIPNRFHPKIAHFLTGVSESDTFPTYYRANSVGRLRRLLGRNQMQEAGVIMYQPPPYAFVFSRIICRIVIAYYNFINTWEWLGPLRGVIIARYQKVGDAALS
jgi:2-polyprenyl-3-methyl-5-hydroxy-6-metoxy-1,4-benzoquinol methylase